MKKRFNCLVGISLLIFNVIFFIPATFEIIRTGGGSWGFGLLLLPITIIGNLYLIPAILVLLKKYQKNRALLIINVLGVLVSTFWIIFYTGSAQ